MCQRSSQLQRERGNRGFQVVVWCFLAVSVLCAHTAHATFNPWGNEHEDRGVVRKMLTHNIQKRSFFNIECKGVYDKVIFSQLDRVCEDCYNLFRESMLHNACKQNCFTSKIFKGCIEALQLTEDLPQYQSWIKQIHGGDPGV